MRRTLVSREDPEDVLYTQLRDLMNMQNDRDRTIVKALVLLRDQLQVINGHEFTLCQDEVISAINDFIDYIKQA